MRLMIDTGLFLPQLQIRGMKYYQTFIEMDIIAKGRNSKSWKSVLPFLFFLALFFHLGFLFFPGSSGHS